MKSKLLQFAGSISGILIGVFIGASLLILPTTVRNIIETKPWHDYNLADGTYREEIEEFIDGAEDAYFSKERMFGYHCNMVDYAVENLYIYDMFDLSYDAYDKDSCYGYVVSPDGKETQLKEPWFVAHYIHGKEMVGNEQIIGGYANCICIPVEGEDLKIPFGTVSTYKLYPLRDCYLSYIGELDTVYDPTDFLAFNFFIDMIEYQYSQEESEGVYDI